MTPENRSTDLNDVRVVVGDPCTVGERGMMLDLEHTPVSGDSDVIDAQQSLDPVRRPRCRQLHPEPFDGVEYRSSASL